MAKTKVLLLLLALCLVVLMVPGLATATTVSQGVYIGSQDYHTIQDALNSADPGDILKILPGTYYEDLLITDKTSVTLDVYSPGAVVTIMGTGTAISITGSSDKITINHLVITGDGTVDGTGDGIALDSSVSGAVYLNQNNISNCANGIFVGSGKLYMAGNTVQNNNVGVAVNSPDSTYVNLAGNEIKENLNGGVQVKAAETIEAVLRDNAINDNEKCGAVRMMATDPVLASINATIEDNDLLNNTGGAIRLGWWDKENNNPPGNITAVINGNKIWDDVGGMIRIKSADSVNATVTNNDFKSRIGDGTDTGGAVRIGFGSCREDGTGTDEAISDSVTANVSNNTFDFGTAADGVEIGGVIRIVGDTVNAEVNDNSIIAGYYVGGAIRIGYAGDGEMLSTEVTADISRNTMDFDVDDLGGAIRLYATNLVTATVNDNTITDTSDEGESFLEGGAIRIGYGCGVDEPTVTINATINGNVIDPSNGGGIRVIAKDTIDAVVKNNTVEGCKGGGIRIGFFCYGFEYEEEVGSGTYQDWVTGSVNAVVEGNTVTGCWSEGIRVDALDALTGSVALNTISGTADCENNNGDYPGAGLVVGGPFPATIGISGNTFVYNPVPVFFKNAPVGQSPLMTDPGTNVLTGRVDIVPEGQSTIWGITQYVQEAVDYATDGATLNIYPGIYKEQVDVNDKGLNLIGAGRDVTVIDSTEIIPLTVSQLMANHPAAPARVKQNAETKVTRESPALPEGAAPQHPSHKAPSMVDGGANVPAVAIYNGLNNNYKSVTIKGLEITGLYLQSADGSIIQDNRFTRSNNEGAYIYDVYAVWNDAGTSIDKPVLISNNIFTGNEDDGLHLQQSYDTKIEGNEFSNNGEEGLDGYDADGLILTGNTFTGNNSYGAYLNDTDNNAPNTYNQVASVTGNDFSGNEYSGLCLDDCWNLLVMDNTMNNNGEDGLDLCDDSENCTVSGNTMTGNGWDGIYMDDAYGCKVSDNTITGNGTSKLTEDADYDPEWILCGVEIYDSYYNEISGNIIEGNKDVGIYLRYFEENLIKNNSIRNNGHLPAEDELFGQSYGGIVTDEYYHDNVISFNNITENMPYGLDVTYNMPPAVGSEGVAPAKIEVSPPANGAPYQSKDMGYYGFTFNWWGDASGPSDEELGYELNGQPGSLLGEGQQVMGDEFMSYMPWLSAPFDAAFPGPAPVYAVPVSSGWHLVSTPYALGLNSWDDVAGFGKDLDASVIVRYDSAGKQWQTYGVSDFTFDPQDAYFIKMNSSDLLPLAVSNNFSTPPVRTLEQGWNLTSLAADEYLPVREALSTAELTADGKRGWVQVVKPPFTATPWKQPESWVYTVNSPPDNGTEMSPVEGYWVYMDNADELAGFTTTGPLAEPDWQRFYKVSRQVLEKQ